MRSTIRNLVTSLTTLLMLLYSSLSMGVGAGCSDYTGRVVINEYNYIDNWIELKVLDDTIFDGVDNPFTGWNLSIFIEGQPNKTTTKSVGASYTVNSLNSCGVATTQTYVQIPFAASEMDNNVNVLLTDGSDEIVDVFRLDQTSLSSYFTGYSCASITYSNLTDGPLLGNSSRKDIARLPDGTGPWVQSPGTGANSQDSLCTTNDSILAITNVPSVTTVGINTNFTFTVTVSNGGTNGSLSNAYVDNLLPVGLTLVTAVAGTVSDSGNTTSYDPVTGVWTVGALDPADSAILTLTVYSATATTYTSTATAYADELAPGYTTADAVVTVSASNIDHYAISHNGTGITCTTSAITITPHDATDVAAAPSNATTITLSTTSANSATETWSLVTGSGTFTAPDQYTFSGSETSVVFGYSQTTAEANIDIDVSDGSATDIDDGDNTNGKDAEDPSITISDSGFVFTVPTQIANKTSTAITISAVKANPVDPTLACTPAFSGARSINFWSSYISPSPYTGTPALSVNGTPVSGAAPGTAISLSFDANAQSTFTTHFADAGKLQLDANYSSAAGADSGLTMSGSSTFVVTPVGFCVQSTDTNSDCASGDATCSAFVAAGAAFNLDVIAKAWESDTDADLCTGNATTPNYVQTSIPFTHTLIAPTGVGTSGGTLGVSSIDIASGGSASLNTQSISEVGVFTIMAAPAAGTYLDGTSVPSGTSVNIGRFYPAAFTTAISNNGSFAAGCSTCTTPFTYLGDSFGYLTTDRPTVLITAVNTAGATTVNYQGAFAMLATPAATIGLTYPATDNSTNNAAGTALLGITSSVGTPTIADNSNGTLTMTMGASTTDLFQYNRELVSPFVADLSIILNTLNDGDVSTTLTTNNVIKPASLQVATVFEQRYGRAVLSDATGSSVTGTVIPIPLSLQFYNATGVFEDNVDDTVTNISSTFLGCTDTNTADTLACLTPTVASVGHGGSYTITADGNSGTLIYSLDLTAASGADLEYLMYDWDSDTTNDNPEATVTLGEYPHYHGEGRFRFWNESN